MVTSYQGKTISAMYSILPSNVVNFMDETSNYAFSESQMRKLQKVMGYGSRRVAKEGETVSDYAVFGIQKMLNDGIFKESEIGAIIVTTLILFKESSISMRMLFALISHKDVVAMS